MSVLNAEQAREATRNQNLQNLFTENKKLYTQLKPMENLVSQLISNNKKITGLIPVKDDNGRAATTNKKDLKTLIAASGGAICSYATDYALETGNVTLYNTVSYTDSSLSDLRDIEVLGVISIIVDAVTPLLSDEGFAGYPVTADDLLQLTNDATTYNDNLGKAGSIDTNSSIASHDINAILKANRHLIIRFSKQILFFEKKNPGFVAEYYKTIKIDYSGIHHSGIKGIISSSITEQPVESATITLEGNTKATAGKAYLKTALSAEDGIYSIIRFRPGKAKLTISAPGFETQVISLTIIRGRILEFNIALLAQITALKEAI